MKEIWKDFLGFKGIYMVSNLGRVKSLERTWYTGEECYIKHYRPEIILKGCLDKNNYRKVILTNNKNRKTLRVGRIIAQAFIDNPLNKAQINTNKTWKHIEVPDVGL